MVPSWPSTRMMAREIGKMAGARSALDDGECATPFDAILVVARSARAGEPLVRLGLENGGPRSSHLPTRAAGGAWCARRPHASGLGPILSLRPGRGLAAWRVPSTAKTRIALPCRSNHPSDGSAFERGRASRSLRKSVRKASTALWSRATRMRRSVERAGRRSRPESARNGSAHGSICWSKASRVRWPLIAASKSTATTSMTSFCPKC